MKNVKTLIAAAVLSSLSLQASLLLKFKTHRQANRKSLLLVLLRVLTSLLLKINWHKKPMRWVQNLSVSPL
jgi:hypothetical protein